MEDITSAMPLPNSNRAPDRNGPRRSSTFRTTMARTEVDFREISDREITIIMAAGIVNPFGPTLAVLGLDAPLEPGNAVQIFQLSLNPFAQRGEFVGHAQLGETWNPQQDLEPFLQGPLEACPTLLLGSPFIDGTAFRQICRRYLQQFNDGQELRAKVQRHLNDPFARVQNDIGKLPEIASRLLSGGTNANHAARLDDSAAIELTDLLLNPECVRKELEAFLFAWKGAISFQGPMAASMATMSVDEVMRFLANLSLPRTSGAAPSETQEPREAPMETAEAAQTSHEPKFDSPSRARARELAEMGRWAELLEFAQAWSKREPLSHLGDYYTGLAYTNLGLTEPALFAYHSAISKNGNDPHVWMNIAVIHQNQGRFEEAVKYQRRAVQVRSGYAHTIRALANMLGHAGQHGEAADAFQMVLELEPMDRESVLLLCKALQASGRIGELLDLLVALRDRFPDIAKSYTSLRASSGLFGRNWRVRNLRFRCSCPNGPPVTEESKVTFVHRYLDRLIQAKIGYVWCVNCKGISTASIPLRFEPAEKLMQEIQRLNSELKDTPPTVGKATFWQSVVGGRPEPNPKIRWLNDRLKTVQTRLICSRLFAQLDAQNHGKVRCLACGNCNTEQISVSFDPEQSRTPTGRNCGKCRSPVVWGGEWLAESPDHGTMITPSLRPWKHCELDEAGRKIRTFDAIGATDIYPEIYLT